MTVRRLKGVDDTVWLPKGAEEGLSTMGDVEREVRTAAAITSLSA